MHYNFRECNESAEEQMRRGFKRERLLGRMTDGWCKGERKGGKLGKLQSSAE